MGKTDRETRDLSGCSALKQEPFCQNKRVAVDKLDVADGNTMGRKSVGFTLFKGVSSVKMVLFVVNLVSLI